MCPFDPVPWALSWRADPAANAIAKRHYNCQSPESDQFVPPGRCLVLSAPGALWVTSWPFPAYVKHAWAGAWVNSLFRREQGGQASRLIREAIAATRWKWPQVPELGMVSFVDPAKVPGVRGRHRCPVTGDRLTTIYGYCYLKACFEHVGYTEGGLWTWQLREDWMPPARPPTGVTPRLFADVQ